MKEIQELAGQSLSGQNVLVRVDYNVSIRDGVILDDLRIRASFKTIEFLRSLGATVILISHIETKEGGGLDVVSDHIQTMHQKGECPFAVEYFNDLAVALSKTKQDLQMDGKVYLFQNLRSDEREESNDEVFAKALASLADIYVNEAFPVCHRKHASIVSLPTLLPHYAGFKLADEIKHMHRGLNATHPFVFILGGAKFETKLPLIEKFMNKSDLVVISGALLNDILKAKGLQVGKSLVSDVHVDLSHIIASPKLIVPQEVIIKKHSDETGIEKQDGIVKKIDEVSDDDVIVDIAPTFAQELADKIAELQTGTPFILWNGPLGLYEGGFKDGTVALAEMILNKKVDGLIGGGDTVAAISHCSLASKIGAEDDGLYISTGGGAMIEFLMKETLPGIEALN